MTQYAYSENEEHFDSEHFFNSRQEAIDAGMAEIDNGIDFMVCEVEKITSQTYMVSGDSYLEIIADHAFDDVGEVSEDWLECTPEQVDDLSSMLQKAFVAWVTKNKLDPYFYKAVNITYHCKEEKINRDKE